MSDKITELPQEVVDRFPEIRDEWIKIGLSTQPADRPRAEAGVDMAYKAADLEPPQVKVWVDSPLQGSMAAAVCRDANTVEECLEKIQVLRDNDFDPDKCSKALGVKKHELYDVFDALYGQFEAGWLSFYSVFKGIVEEVDKLDGVMEIAKSAGWWWPFEGIAIITERPTSILLDEEGRLHSQSEAAVSYRDGWSLYFFHGVSIPSEWIEDKLPSAAEAVRWSNIEQRRAACEMIGWASILDELNAKVIDEDGDPEIGILLEVMLPNGDGDAPSAERFLKVKCGTGRYFALPVPPDMKTALEAQSWTWGMDTTEFVQPEVRT